VEELANLTTELMNMIEDRQMRLSILRDLVEDVKNSFRVDISPFVEKIPRSMKFQKTRRALR
jgi:hypothetical protein